MSERSEVYISLSVRNLPLGHFEYYYATLRVATGGYFHDKDATTTEKKEEQNNLDFHERLNLEYIFEEKQIIRIELYGLINGDSACVSVSECSVGRVIHSGGEMTKLGEWCWRDNKEEMEYIFIVSEDPASKDNLEIKMQGYGLDKKDLFGKSDPYMMLYRRTDRNKLIRTYRSEVVKNNLNPVWKPIVVSLQRLCNNDLSCEILFRCFDWDGANGDPEDMDTEFDELIGEFATTTRELLSFTGEEKKFELINPRKKRKKKNYHHSGLVTIKTIQTVTSLTFLDYMFGGTDLNFIVAIDLTSSNGNVDHPNSLHFMDSNNNNEYMVAIQAVLEILQEYDNDELFPAFGFGARVPPDYKISHEYPLNGDYANPFCKGVEGVMRAYRETLRLVTLSGPTHFAPVMRQVSNLARQHRNGSHYFILLILTDGSVDDWKETKRAVIETSYLPVSVIVIGVGGGRFSDMETLDQDFKLLRVGNEEACRDNVQFVQMRRFLRPAADGSDSIRWNKVSLAKEVLAELPAQVIEYMGRHQNAPGPRRSQNLRFLSMRDLLMDQQTSSHQRLLTTFQLCSSGPFDAGDGDSDQAALTSTSMMPTLAPDQNEAEDNPSSNNNYNTNSSNNNNNIKDNRITGDSFNTCQSVNLSDNSGGFGRLRRCATSSYEEQPTNHYLAGDSGPDSRYSASGPMSASSCLGLSISDTQTNNTSVIYSSNNPRRSSSCLVKSAASSVGTLNTAVSTAISSVNSAGVHSAHGTLGAPSLTISGGVTGGLRHQRSVDTSMLITSNRAGSSRDSTGNSQRTRSHNFGNSLSP